MNSDKDTKKIIIGQNIAKVKTNVLCHITNKLVPASEATQGHTIRPSVFELIRAKFPDFADDKYISDDELSKFKIEHIRSLLVSERGKLSDMEKAVAETVTKHDFMSKDFTKDEDETFTFGERIADRIAEFGGSWKFIISFLVIMAIWICGNVYMMTNAFDPYPYILLNLVLSCIASLQAPVIMMSQNRAEKKDRTRAINSYMVGLKTEIELRHLHEKTDRLLEIHIMNENEMHELQMDTMEKIMKKVDAIDKKMKT